MFHLCKCLYVHDLVLIHEIEKPRKWLDDVITIEEIEKEILLGAEIKTLQTTVKTTEVKIAQPKDDEHYVSGYIKWESTVPRKEFVSNFDFNKVKLAHKSDRYKFVFLVVENK